MNTASFVFTIPAPQEPPPVHPARGGRHRNWGSKGLCLVGLGLLANAAVLLYTHITGRAPDLVLDRSAFAQAAPGGSAGTLLGARGIYMMPAQLGNNTWGVYLLDVDSQTICVYRAAPESSHFRFMAARSFQYDRFVTDFNNEKPTPKEIQRLIEDQRQRQELQLKGEQPTVDQAAKPDENLPDGGAANRVPQ